MQLTSRKFNIKRKKRKERHNTLNKVYNILVNNEKHVTKTVVLINKDCNIKTCKIGFSCSNFFLPVVSTLYKGDYKNALIQTLLFISIGFISIKILALFWILYSIFYNKLYVKELLRSGYKPIDTSIVHILESENIL